ncbi:Wax ester synthase/diacylglycerol acyltransferase 4 [Linum grandiflorum]
METKKQPILEHEIQEDEDEEEQLRRRPVSPFGVYFHSRSIQLAIIAVLEIEQLIDIPLSDIVSLLHTLLLPLHPRFSSVIVTGKDGEQRWKKVEINVKDHIRTAVFPAGKSPEYYDNCLQDYLSKLSADQFPETRPLWEIHFFKYPTTAAAGHVIFKIHHAIGDGYSLMAALLSCFKRFDDPSLPLTFPNNRIRRQVDDVEGGGGGRRKPATIISRALSAAVNTVSDMWLSFSKAKVAADDISPIRSGEIGVGYRPISAATMTFSLDQIKEMKSRLGVTVNDVVTSIVFLGTRMYMQEMKPGSEDADTTAIVLLNTRMLRSYNSVKDMMKPDTESPWGNRFAFLHITLPKLMIPKLDHAEKWTTTMQRRSVEFLKASRTVIQNKRSSIAVHLNAKMLDLYWKLKGSEAASRYVYLAVKNTSMAITNMIGPTEKMTLAGHHVKGMYFIAAGNPQNLTVTMVSYMGQMRVTIGVEKDFIDPNKLKSCIQAAFDLLKSTI